MLGVGDINSPTEEYTNLLCCAKQSALKTYIQVTLYDSRGYICMYVYIYKMYVGIYIHIYKTKHNTYNIN